ncbi:DUF4349 domain-containing protein [Kamptonema cortianum]|nr:DUF4349 domain-containing protein [Geitlerinema splendidum]MDK3157034.1 DUF4349 domain-containing protein [Kamptonema cortianum]
MKKALLMALPLLMMFGCEAGGSYAPAETESALKMEAASEGSDGSAASPAVQSLLKDRIVIRNASITVRVKEADFAEGEAKKIVQAAGGYVESSYTRGLGTPRPSINLAIRVPVQKFESTLENLAKLGTVLEKSQGAEDVTEQVVDLEARMKTLKVQEETYRGLLARSSKIEDVIKLEDRLAEVRVEIERLDAQRRGLRDQASFSTISLNLTQEAQTMVGTSDEGWAGEAWGDSVQQLLGLFRALVSAGIWFLVMSPFWLPGLLFIIWLAKRKPKSPQS